MRKVMFASMLVLGLAACGGGGGDEEAVLTKAFLEEGDCTEEECACLAKEMVENLDPKLVDIMVEATEVEDPDAFMMSKMGELEPIELQSLMTVMISASGECGVEM